MPSPSQIMAMRKLMNASAALEVQFDKDATRRPVLFLLKKARDAAAEAMDAIVFCDPEDGATVRQLQHEIRRYDDLVTWCREIINEGREADQRLAEIDRQEFASAITDPDNEDDVRNAGGTMEN